MHSSALGSKATRTVGGNHCALRAQPRTDATGATQHSGLHSVFQIDHLGIAVKSLASAKAIYEKLGLAVSPEETVEHEQVRLVMVPVGESRLELLEATSENSTIARFIAKRGEGLHHVCLKVPDLVAAVDRLRKDGVRLVSEEIKTGAGGHQYVFVHPSSTGGVLLELVQG
jgi:methylmalonyl-CoA epimerase